LGDAQNALGEAARDGRGCERDAERAEHWFRAAAEEAQHECAMNNLGLMCQVRRGPSPASA
jgi:TPR repeat protein